jgi:hypothetical protein
MIHIWERNLRTRGVQDVVAVTKHCIVTRFKLHHYTSIKKLKSQENQFYGKVNLTWYFVTSVLVKFRDTLFSFTYTHTHTHTHTHTYTLLTSPRAPYLFVLFNSSDPPHYAVLYVCVFIISSAWCFFLTNSHNTLMQRYWHAHNTHFQQLRSSHGTKELNILKEVFKLISTYL